jgi:hypothetical protein
VTVLARAPEPSEAGRPRHNVPSGWARFRELGQEPGPAWVRQHGNYRHGRYSQAGIADRREFRLLLRILRTGAWHIPLPGSVRRTPAPSWAGYRTARDARADRDE